MSLHLVSNRTSHCIIDLFAAETDQAAELSAASQSTLPSEAALVFGQADTGTTTKQKSTTPKFWTRSEAQLLLTTRLGMEAEFNGSKAHAVLWGKVKDSLLEAGLTNITSVQCSNKFKQMKREWRQILDYNSQTGVEPKTCSFFNEFNEVYGCKASSKPSFTLASATTTTPRERPRTPTEKRPETPSTSSDTLMSPPRSPIPRKKMKKTHKSKGKDVDVINFYQVMKQDRMKPDKNN